MKVSIEDNLVNIKNELKSLGYEVYNFSENVTSDAYIYSEKNTGLHNLNNWIKPGQDGSLLVDVDGKTLGELQYILSNRLYSPLFKVTNSPADYV